MHHVIQGSIIAGVVVPLLNLCLMYKIQNTMGSVMPLLTKVGSILLFTLSTDVRGLPYVDETTQVGHD